MYVKDATTGQGAMRDVVMPGIGLYRIQAQRSGCYAGQSDPDFGEDVTESVGGFPITYPKWCKITISKMMPNGRVVEFSAKEFWKENYATSGKDSSAPNAMWKKRPYAQLAKCAEAQALRKAFPDILDQSPTAEEMEGKHFEFNDKHVKQEYAQSHVELLIKNKKPLDISDMNETVTLKDSVEAVLQPFTTYEQVKKQLLNAKSKDTLDLAADLIRECPVENHSELNEIWIKRQNEVK
jgi:phage recombination protein Bet